MSSSLFPVRARAAFAHPEFRYYQGARFLATVGGQMQSVAVGWQIYEITGDPLHLGWIGLAQFLPMVLLSLVSGHVADRFDRRRVLATCHLGAALAASGLAASALTGPELPWMYALVVMIGVSRAFHGPAGSALLPTLVPRHEFANAVAWSSTIWQVATVSGPALGGLLYGLGGAVWAYALTAVSLLASLVLVLRIPTRPAPSTDAAAGFDTLFSGLRFVWREKPILGAISLDLFAVLLGGAVALLPALARDVLDVGPTELGLMRGAPALGAALTAVWLAHRPLARRAGRVMLGSVALFGAATVVLGLSRVLAVSLVALVVLGAADMVSVFVRQNLVQLGTPDAMRGRVSAVNLVFIGASNELGEFESGVTAAWLGVVPAIVVGGVGTIVVVAVYSLLFPSLRRIDRLDELAS